MIPELFSADPNQRFALAREVLLQRFEDKALLLDIGAERVYQLNDTAARIVELLSEGRSFGTILAGLEETYSESPADLQAQAGALIRELIAQGLAVRVVD